MGCKGLDLLEIEFVEVYVLLGMKRSFKYN